MEENKNEDFLGEGENQVYELGYHILPIVNEEDTVLETNKIKDYLFKVGASIVSEGVPSMRQLAYEMSKNVDGKNLKVHKAYFGWIKFELNTSKVVDFKKFIDLNQNILRYLIVKTVKENTMFTPKVPTFKKEQKEEGFESVDKTEDVSKVDIDKSIDNLVDTIN